MADGDATKKNLPLLRAVKEGKVEKVAALIDSGEVNVNFQNHCACALYPEPSPQSLSRGPQSLSRGPQSLSQMATRR